MIDRSPEKMLAKRGAGTRRPDIRTRNRADEMTVDYLVNKFAATRDRRGWRCVPDHVKLLQITNYHMGAEVPKRFRMNTVDAF